MKRSQDIFQTVKTEGALLPPDLLRRIIEGDRDLQGLLPEDYHLVKSERINEAATRAWNRLQGVWQGFKDAIDKLPESEIGTSLTRERWLLILFQELGYGRLTTSKAYEIGGKTYPISHEWQSSPIHLVSFRQELDKRTPGRAGAARVSPHSLVQEFLSRSENHLWGFVSNGLNLRLLRDNVSMTRQAYIEFDLQAMMDSEAYSDFFLLFLICHQSRVEVPEGKSPEHCWLEKWYHAAAQQGVRALEQLRDGVQKAIEALGGGFLAYPGNAELREKLRSGALGTQDFYRQVLRLVYRLLFLFVAEDRELLLDPESPVEKRRLYNDHYSTLRLRRLAGKTRGTRHPDLWRALRLVLSKLHNGCPELALPALGSYLFSADATPDLNEQDIANVDLLKAFRSLAFTIDRNILRSINYRNMGPEELGSVYESLLEMHPEIHIDASNPGDRFRLTVVAGSERKTTGSYYTPTSLVNCLLDTALNPVLDEASRKSDSEKTLLALKICDPACGSGHFLIAAAHRLAKRLASIRAGEEEPAPEHYQRALRDVISHCIYGVDINPMSVELCKVNLWLEAIEPGKPLAFLDHHIKCGNSLLGTTPVLLREGITDDAFNPIEGDDKEFCSYYRKQNKKERQTGQAKLLAHDAMPWERLGNLPAAMMQLDRINDATLDGVAAKEKRYADYVKSAGYEYCKLWADAWCAAFVWKKNREFPYPITEEVFRRIERNPHTIPDWMKEEIKRLAKEYQFFHWHIEFPEVFHLLTEIDRDSQNGWKGGFDCVMGNPPWERIKLQEKEWFAQRAPEIANAPNAAQRKRMIENLNNTNAALYNAYHADLRKANGESCLVRDSGRFPLCGRGDVNTYTIFAELKRDLLNSNGRVGCIVPSGIATDDTTKFFFQDLMDTNSLASLYDFENSRGLFPGVHRSYKFCLLTLGGKSKQVKAGTDFVFFAHGVEDLSEKERHFTLTAEEIALLNPNTRTCPIFRSKKDAELTKYIYRRVPVLIKEARDGRPEENPWGIKFSTMFHMTNDSHLFRTREELETEGFVLKGNVFEKGEEKYLPLYEGKMIWQLDHRAASVDYKGALVQGRHDSVSTEVFQYKDYEFVAMPRMWINLLDTRQRIENHSNSLISFRDITNSESERTNIFTIIPNVAAGNNLPLITSLVGDSLLKIIFVAEITTFVSDFISRLKLGGNHMNFFLLKQLLHFSPQRYELKSQVNTNDINLNLIIFRTIELIYTAIDLEPFALDCGYNGPPFIWDEERRFMMRAELDALYFHLYLGDVNEWRSKGAEELLKYFHTPRDAVAYIMETFPIVKRKDEQKYGSYRTKETILEIYDEMAEAMLTGKPYQTRLDPPPGPPVDEEGNFIPLAKWDKDNWPRHVHRAKD